jgi:putative transposase
MKVKRFSEEQIVRILREAETGGKNIADVCRAHGITETTFYRWRPKFAGLPLPEVRRLRELEKENARIKRLHPQRVHVRLLRELLLRVVLVVDHRPVLAQDAQRAAQGIALVLEAGDHGHIRLDILHLPHLADGVVNTDVALL